MNAAAEQLDLFAGADEVRRAYVSSAESSAPPPAPLVVAGRTLEPSPVYNTYWRFAAERHSIYRARVAGHPGPWTADPILNEHRFTTCYRAADRVSQYLIRDVIYTGAEAVEEVVFRTLLFKFFNRVSTWELLQNGLTGDITWEDFSVARYDGVLSFAKNGGERLYSAAHIIPAPPMGRTRKHTNHLQLLDLVMEDRLPARVADAKSLEEVYGLLRACPGLGRFLAYQLAIDLNYSPVVNHDEMEFVVAGPGARDGIRKCFGPAANGIEADVIRAMADRQEQEFERLGLRFGGLWGRRLQLIDCQGLFCEVDKYARLAHPEVAGVSGRQRIKQRFTPVASPVTAWFPPKWGVTSATNGGRDFKEQG